MKDGIEEVLLIESKAKKIIREAEREAEKIRREAEKTSKSIIADEKMKAKSIIEGYKSKVKSARRIDEIDIEKEAATLENELLSRYEKVKREMIDKFIDFLLNL